MTTKKSTRKKREKVPPPKETKRGRGRPPLYRPEFPRIAYNACFLGATNEDLAETLDVSIQSIENWLRTKAEFSASVKRGRAVADAQVAKSLFKRAVGCHVPDSHVSSYLGQITVTPLRKHYPPDVAACIIWLKNRRPDLWREKDPTLIGNQDPREFGEKVRNYIAEMDEATNATPGEMGKTPPA